MQSINKIFKIGQRVSLHLLAFLILLCFPVVAHMQGSGLVPCTDNCQFNHLFVLVANIVQFLIFTLALPLVALVITYAGVIMVLNPANEGKRKDALGMIYAAVWGLGIALAAYLIVDTLLKFFAGSAYQLPA